MPELLDLFTTYLAVEQLDVNNEKLAEYALELEDIGDGRTVSNQGGFQSNDIMDPPEVLEPLYNKITNFGNELCERIGIAPVVLYNMWVNVNRYRDFNWPHSHNQAIISGVYYVKTPENSGKIAVRDPRAGFTIQWGSRFADKIHDLYNQNMIIELDVKERDLIIFPGFLDHFVKPSTSDEERISISFDIDCI